MKNSFNLTITLQSFLLSAAGEGSALIDSDVVFQKNGFPYIPGRRLKGLLKESYREVLEIYLSNESEYKEKVEGKVDTLFGVQGKSMSNAKLHFDNFYIINYTQIQKELSDPEKYDSSSFAPENVKRFFTHIIAQTAVEDDGIAKDKSLRNYRVLKPEIDLIQNDNSTESSLQFNGCIAIKQKLDTDELNNLNKAILHMRAAGTRRNRGFGKIKCAASEEAIKNANEAAFEATNSKEFNHDELNQTDQSNIRPVRSLGVKIETLSQIVLSLQLGEQNTVFTEKWISGNRLRGLLAYLFVQTRLNNDFTQAHLDADFRDIFLSGKVNFNFCYPSGQKPLPLNIHEFKGRDLNPVDVFNKPKDPKELKDYITRSVNGVGNYSLLQKEPQNSHKDINILKKGTTNTSFNFHNSRLDRKAGRSTKADPGIFYYEAIDEGQTFEGMITGNSITLGKLANSLSGEFKTRIGRSRSAQYGKIKLTLQESSSTDSTILAENNEYLLIAESPIILLNKYGFPEPNKVYLSTELGGSIEIVDESVSARITWIEQLNTAWMAKSGKIPAFKEGTVFKIKISGDEQSSNKILENLKSNGIGAFTHMGFGRVRLESVSLFPQVFQKNSLETESNVHNVEGAKSQPDNLILQSIQYEYQKEQMEFMLRFWASKKGESYNTNKVSGNLLSRLLAILSSSERLEDWQKKLGHFKDKQAGKTLQRIHEWDDLFELHTEINTDDFELQKLYWKNVFITARKLKKVKK